MKPELVLIPTLSIHPHQINFYREINWHPYKPSRDKKTYLDFKESKQYDHLLTSKRTAQGNVSQIARRKIGKAIDYLLLMADDKYINKQITGRAFNFKVAFITLTLPSKQIHSDNEIKRKCLNSFLIELERYHKIKNYVWRAELQKNGNIHFHILIDKFVHWNDIRNRWNRIINKLGYVDNYRIKMKEFYKDGFKIRKDLEKWWPEKNQRASYKANQLTDYHNPNSTDIHSLKKIRNIKVYLIKYLTKKDESKQSNPDSTNTERIQQGRIWSASKNLQNIKGCQVPLDSELENEITKVVNQSRCESYDGDYYSVFMVSMEDVLRYGGERLYKHFSEYLLATFDYSLQKPLLL